MRKAIQWTRGEQIARWSVVGGVMVLATLTLWFSLRDESRPPELKAGSDLVLTLARMKPDKLLLFSYRIDPSRTTPVALQKGSDGIVRAALASCPACPKAENYESSGRLICAHCQHVMKMPDPIVKVNEKSGGCAPISLAYSIVGDELVVRGETIVAEYSRQFRHRNARQGMP